MGLLAPNPRKLPKKLDQNFQTLVQCEHCAFDRQAQKLWQKIIPQVSKFLKDRGVGKGKLLSRSFLSPRKNIKNHNPVLNINHLTYLARSPPMNLGRVRAQTIKASPIVFIERRSGTATDLRCIPIRVEPMSSPA